MKVGGAIFGILRGETGIFVVDNRMGLWPISDHIEAIRERPIHAFCTYSHHDHAGGLFQFSNRLGHSAKAEIFVNPIRANTVAGLLAPSIIKTPPNPAFDASSWCYPSALLTLEVSKGDVIDLGNRVLQTLHLPGHSPGSVGLWEANSGLLITGGCFLRWYAV